MDQKIWVIFDQKPDSRAEIVPSDNATGLRALTRGCRHPGQPTTTGGWDNVE